MDGNSQQARRSLRTILIFWFVVFASIPLFFVVGYSIKKFEEGLDHELGERLVGNSREITAIFKEDFEKKMDFFGKKIAANPSVVIFVASDQENKLREIGEKLFRGHFGQRLAFFNSEGRRLLALVRVENNEIQSLPNPPGQAWYLADDVLAKIKPADGWHDIQFNATNGDSDANVELLVYHHLKSRSGQLVGIVEQALVIDRNFLQRVQQRMGVEDRKSVV